MCILVQIIDLAVLYRISYNFFVWRCLKCISMHMMSAVVLATLIQQVDHTTLTEDVSYWPTVVYTFGKAWRVSQCNSVSYLAVRYKKFIEIILLFSVANKIILYCKNYCISIVYKWMLVISFHLVETSAMNALVDQVFNSATVYYKCASLSDSA